MRYAKGPRPERMRDPWDDEPFVPSLTVTDGPVDTGLVWPTGEKIMRVPNPIGFGRDKDW